MGFGFGIDGLISVRHKCLVSRPAPLIKLKKHKLFLQLLHNVETNMNETDKKCLKL
jgi:hypothetical protein